MYHVHVVLTEVKEGVPLPVAGATGSCEPRPPPCGCSEWNSDPLGGQLVILTAGPLFQPFKITSFKAKGDCRLERYGVSIATGEPSSVNCHLVE